MMHQLLVLASAALVVPAAASQTSDFRDCFCWNTTADSFCGGSDFFKQHSCNRWVISAFAWTIPALIGLFVLLLFPCVFYCSRVCCRCCGGRHRSFGCCCSDEESRHRFPGYSNRTIFIAKILMLTVFGAYIYYAVGGYTSNAKLHTDVLETVSDLGNSISEIDASAMAAANATFVLYQASVLSQAQYEVTLAGAQKFHHRAGQIHTVLNDLRNVERNQQWGRAESVYRYPSCVLMVLMITVIFMVCNVRKAMGPMLVLVCLTSIAEGAVFIPHMVFAQGTSALCGSYNETLVPVVVGAIESQHGCNDPHFNDMSRDAAKWIYDNAWTSTSSYCVDFNLVCGALRCPTSTCGTKNTTQLPFDNWDTTSTTMWQLQNLELALTNPSVDKAAIAAANASSVLECAQTCTDPNLRAAASRVKSLFDSVYPAASVLLMEVFPASYNCSGVTRRLRGEIHDDICDSSMSMRASTVAMVLGVMYLISFISLPVIARGMKRFVAMKNGAKIADVAQETIIYVDGRVCAIATPVVEDDDDGQYNAVNDEDGEQQALRTRDSAHFRRFYGIPKSPVKAV